MAKKQNLIEYQTGKYESGAFRRTAIKRTRTTIRKYTIEPKLFDRILHAALNLAKLQRCTIEKLLIHSGEISEQELYRNLAARLGVPFIPYPVRLISTIAPLDALRCGLAPVDQHPHRQPIDIPTFIYAPQSDKLAWLIENNTNKLNLPGSRIAITTPSAFRSSIRAHFSSTIAKIATSQIIRLSPYASAFSISARSWIIGLSALVSLITASILISISLWHWTLLMLTCFPILPGLILKIQALRNSAYGDLSAPELNQYDLPTYCVLVPIYQEALILPQLIAALLQLDYPTHKLDIKLLVEMDDIETLSSLDSIVLPAHIDILICPRGSPRTKPRALTIGLAHSQSDFVTVYDAEDVPDRDQLKKAASIFACHGQNLACIQAKLAIDNIEDSWFSRQFATEYAGLFDILLPGLSFLEQPIPLGGTSNHFRRSALEAVAGWDPWNVTEDADLGLRLFRAGFRIKTFNSTTFEEAPTTISAWMNQRTRWLKGWMQTAVVHLRSQGRQDCNLTLTKWSELGIAASLAPLCTLFHPLLVVMIDFIIEHFSGDGSSTVNFVFQIAFSCLFAASFFLDITIAQKGAKARNIKINFSHLIGIVPYSLLKTWAAWRALFELIYAPFHWRKTAHGRARTSRRDILNPLKTVS